MVKITLGRRIAKEGNLAVGCSAAVFDTDHHKMLLIRRVDNGRWAAPGGDMESGESISEACQREVIEETGLSIEIERLIGVYTSPNLLLEYPDRNKWQLVVLHFEVSVLDGELTLGDETADIGYFSQAEVQRLQMGPLDHRRVRDSFARHKKAIICDDFVFDSEQK